MTKTDLIIIGAGPGGYRAAEHAAKAGLQVIIIEADDVGGTCLNVGCIPTKTYVHSTSFDEARQRTAQVIPQLRAGVEGILTQPGITLVRGHAHFIGKHQVTAGDDFVADNILIATGSSPRLLPLPDADDPRVVTSTGLLAMDHLPKRLAIIGAGVIGMEFASVFRRFGAEVTVTEYLKECLPMLDADIAKRLRKLMEKRGITFHMKSVVERLSDIDADTILMAVGRRPNTDNLGLEATEVKLNGNGTIATDNHFLAAPGIYAIGDVNGKQLLAHAAEMQALHVVNRIAGREDGIRFDIMPAAIFTEPEAACVGTIDGICHKAFWRANGKAQAMGETEGMLKLFSEGNDGRITGCHAYGVYAAFLVQEVAALMCRDTTLAQIRDMTHIHPTLSEVLTAAVWS